MKLYLLRHAHAEPLGFEGIKHDKDRPLSEVGKKQSEKVGRALRKMDIKPDYIITSPYKRTKDTAKLVAEEIGYKEDLIETEALLSDSSPKELVQELKKYKQESSIIAIGHQPHLGIQVSYLVWGKVTIEFPIKKAGMACLQITDPSDSVGDASLEWLLTYEQLSMLKD